MAKDVVPQVHFYDQDFVYLYGRTWAWINEYFNNKAKTTNTGTISLYDTCINSLFLAYSNSTCDPFADVDYFYSQQGDNGAIFDTYNLENNEPVFTENNPTGLSMPLLPYVEFFFYHKTGEKKRLKTVVENLGKYFDYLMETYKDENGFYTSGNTSLIGDIPRDNVKYSIDFNALIANAALYMAYIGDVLNDKEISFKYRRIYYGIKTRINNSMWDSEDGFYYDLDANLEKIKAKHIGAFFTMVAEIPNNEYAGLLIEQLKNPDEFGTNNPFPTVPVSSPYFSETGNGNISGVVPFFTYLIIKGLDKYDNFVFSRECAIRHLYFILDSISPPDEQATGDFYEIYLPNAEGPSTSSDPKFVNRKHHLPMLGIVSISLMIENILGFDISLPRKTIDWNMPSLEPMGIEKISLKKNYVTILANKNSNGWEIRLESDKLYYFTIHIFDTNTKKNLPIPSGKCSMLMDQI